MNVETIFYRYNDFVLPDGEQIHPPAKDSEFSSMYGFTEKYIKLPKWSCVLNCFSECPGVFFPDAEMNDEDDTYLPFVRFRHYEDISSCSLNKQLLP